MQHTRYVVSSDSISHPEDCRARGTWCATCGCCEHCVHDCACTDCSCSTIGDQRVPTVTVITDETPDPTPAGGPHPPAARAGGPHVG